MNNAAMTIFVYISWYTCVRISQSKRAGNGYTNAQQFIKTEEVSISKVEQSSFN
jgi:hypothetical protein